jgi:hypothetical protein
MIIECLLTVRFAGIILAIVFLSSITLENIAEVCLKENSEES